VHAACGPNILFMDSVEILVIVTVIGLILGLDTIRCVSSV